MEKIKEFLKNKSIGYFIVAGDAILALLLAIVYFFTYQGAMANNAAANVPETIGIFLIAGAIVELAVLVIPQYRFVHIAGIVMYSLALFKEIILIPNLIADYINKVFYQGGNLGINVFYLVTLLIIVIAAIVAAFLGFYKVEDEAKEDAKIGKGDLFKIIRVSAAGVVVLAAVLASSLVAVDMQNNMNVAGTFNPLTKKVVSLANKTMKSYNFDPNSVLIKEKATYDYNDANLKKVNDKATRSGHNMVYCFEGAYAEGYQGDYSETYGNLYLWDDGLFGGKINSTTVKGFWFNSSLSEGKDAQGADIKDCLKMVSNVEKYESIITQEATGFYERNAYVYLGFSWGTRSMILNGFKYYPECAIAVDTTSAGTKFTVGETFDVKTWIVNRVLANCNYSPVLKSGDVKWTKPSGLFNSKNVIQKAGSYEITAKYNGMEAKVKIKVAKAPVEK